MSHTPVIQQLLDNNGLSLSSVTQALGVLASGAIDYGDLYFQRSRSESWMLEDGIIKEGHHDREQGVGVRACYQDKSGFAYSDELSLPALQAAVTAARGIVRGGQSGQLDVTPQAVSATSRYLPLDPLASLSELDKLKLLRDMEAEARRLDPAVEQVICSLAGSYEEMLCLNPRRGLTLLSPVCRDPAIGDRRAQRPPRARHQRRRRPHRLPLLPRRWRRRRGAPSGLRPRGGASGPA